MGRDRFTLTVAAFASLGTFLYGFDTGIATTTIAHDSWQEYMQHPSDGLTGAVVATYIAGEACGAVMQILIADKLGRIRFMQLAAVLVTIGVSIQTASQNIGMFLAGRVIAGWAVGALSGTVPVYLSEIGSPRNRGLIGGLGGVGLSLGAMTANWVGFAGGYAPYGPVQWRVPLAIQIPWGIILFIGLSTFMPDSPRHLIQRGKVEDARRDFARIRSDLESHEAREEFELMKAQIEYEAERRIPSYGEMFKLYRHRALVCIAVQVLTSVTGVNVVQYYQTTLYASLGIESQEILALAAVFGTCAFLSNAISVRYLPDRWGRRKMLLTGVSCVIITEIYSAVMARFFANDESTNKVGKGFAILGIYIFIICYCKSTACPCVPQQYPSDLSSDADALINSVTWLYGAEVVPMFIRSRMVGLSAVAHYVVNVGLTEAGPSAFANIHENYYYVFVGCCSVYLVLIYLYFPETNQKTLEEIAAAFGDRVVNIDEPSGDKADLGLETNAKSAHVEDKTETV